MKKQPEITAATRQNFMNAFWCLYKEKSVDKISVSEITTITGNNRGTFYHYFTDVYDVLEQIEAELIQEIKSEISVALASHITDSKSRNINVLYTLSLPVFKKHEDKLFTLLGKHGDPKFTSMFKLDLQTMIMDFWNMPPETEHIDYMIEYTYSAMIGLMTKWYENGNDLTDDEFLKIAQGLVANGIIGYFKSINQ